LRRGLRFASGPVLAALVCMAASLSADAAAPTGPSLPAACTSGTPGKPFTLAQARACAPGAPVLPASARLTRDGTFIVARGSGYAVMSRSSTSPTRVAPVAGLMTATTLSAATSCFEGSQTVIDGGGIIEWLGAELCYNYSVAWASNVQSNCIAFLQGFFCLGRYQGTFGNYSRLAGAWGNYYNLFGIFQMNTGIRLDVQPNGNWWGWSYDCARSC
jgi:hypothetical protein